MAPGPPGPALNTLPPPTSHLLSSIFHLSVVGFYLPNFAFLGVFSLLYQHHSLTLFIPRTFLFYFRFFGYFLGAASCSFSGKFLPDTFIFLEIFLPSYFRFFGLFYFFIFAFLGIFIHLFSLFWGIFLLYFRFFYSISPPLFLFQH